MLIIIYVGAITVLFLFVVMMLDIKITTIHNNTINFLPLISIISFIFIIETFLAFSKTFISANLQRPTLTFAKLVIKGKRYPIEYNTIPYNKINFINYFDTITNIETLGQILYTYYAFFILVSGLILLIALIGAVMLTTKERLNKVFFTKRLYKQLSRNYLSAIYNIK